MSTAIVQLIIALCQDGIVTNQVGIGVKSATWTDKRCVADVSIVNPITPYAAVNRYELVTGCWKRSDSYGGRDMEKYKKCLKGNK